MTKEQERAIKVLEKYKQECIEEYKIELDDKKNIDEQHASYLHQQIESVYTVLNMLKEKDGEIEKKEKLNKVLIDFIYKMSTIRPGTIMYDLKEDGFDTSKCGNCKGKSCKDCIKQYFERKAKK